MEVEKLGPSDFFERYAYIVYGAQAHCWLVMIGCSSASQTWLRNIREVN
jgi:hypothetical protein